MSSARFVELSRAEQYFVVQSFAGKLNLKFFISPEESVCLGPSERCQLGLQQVNIGQKLSGAPAAVAVVATVIVVVVATVAPFGVVVAAVFVVFALI